MFNQATKVLFGAYLATSAIFCLCTKLEDHRFATSDFCKNQTLLDQSGQHGPQHCLEHLRNWESYSSWKDEYLRIVFPSLPPEVSLALAVAIVSASKWLDVCVLVLGVITLGALLKRATEKTKHLGIS